MSDRVEIDADMMNHPIVGAGLTKLAKGQMVIRKFSKFEAWLWLNCCDFCETVSGDNTHKLSQELPVNIDVCKVWGWSVKETRIWISGLKEYDLVTEGLHDALQRSIASGIIDRTRLQDYLRANVWSKTGGLCVYCGCELTKEGGKPNSFHADHVLPAKLGGSDDIANLVPSCASCNGHKSSKTALRFMG